MNIDRERVWFDQMVVIQVDENQHNISNSHIFPPNMARVSPAAYYIVLDVETSHGVGEVHASIIELGCVLVDASGSIVKDSEFSRRIRPFFPDTAFNPCCVRVHKIREDDVKHCIEFPAAWGECVSHYKSLTTITATSSPTSLTSATSLQLAPDPETAIDSSTEVSICLVAHNGHATDFRALRTELRRHGLHLPSNWRNCIDTLSMLRAARSVPSIAALYQQAHSSFGLMPLHQAITGGGFNHHTALADAIAKSRILVHAPVWQLRESAMMAITPSFEFTEATKRVDKHASEDGAEDDEPKTSIDEAVGVQEVKRRPREKHVGSEEGMHGLSATVTSTLLLFQSGVDIDEIAAKRGLSASTVTSHLAEAIRSGQPVDFTRFSIPHDQHEVCMQYDPADSIPNRPVAQQAIVSAVSVVGLERRKLIKEHAEAALSNGTDSAGTRIEVPYSAVSLVLAHMAVIGRPPNE